MLKHLINKSKKVLAGAMAVFMMASSTLSAQAHIDTPKEETIPYIMEIEGEEAIYGTKEWNFVNDGTDGCYTDTTHRKEKFDFNGMTIDTTNGEIYSRTDNTAIEKGSILTIPVAGDYTIAVKGYYYVGAGLRSTEQDISAPAAGDHTLTLQGSVNGSGTVEVTTYGNGIWVKTITVVSTKPINSEDLYGEREWIFDGSEGSYTDTTHRKDIFSFNQMTIDATKSGNGVYHNPEKQCTQFEPTVTVTIPAVGNYQLTVTGFFYSNATVSVDGKESEPLSGDKILNFGGVVKDGVITLVMAGNGAWIKNIKVTCTKGYDPIQSYVENRKIDVWDFGTVEETDSGKYTNYITKSFYDGLDSSLFKSKGIFEKAGQYEFGDLTWFHQDSDRIYYNSADGTTGGVHSADNKADKYKNDFKDGYISLGAYYAAGVGTSGGMGGRCVEIKNVLPGDVITAYMMVENADMDLHFLYQGGEGEQDDVVRLITKEYTKKEFVAEYAGTYKLYLNNGAGKPRFLRVTRTPNVLIKGKINLSSNNITGYEVVLEDKNSGKRINATVYQDGTFAALVPANTTLTAILTGAKGYGFTDNSKGITTTTTVLENIELVVEAKSLSELSGTISGFGSDFDRSNLTMVLSCTDPNSLKEDVTLEIADDWTYSAQLENDVEYQLTMTGANDYELTEDVIIKLTSNDTKNIVVKTKSEYPVSGKFIGLGADAQVEQITFINLEDKYSYSGTTTADGYTGNLRNGDYEIIAPVNGYTMIAHIVVNNASVEKDLLYLSTAKEEIAWMPDVYVGYPTGELEADAYNYSTVREAVKACAAMNPSSEEQRITVHIYPGVYREQIIIETPYLTFVNDDPTQDVILTWYYGVGYKYYSVSADGYYDENLAFDKYSQNSVNKWGASVYLKSKATDFRAENIVFETSFNRYITKEEIADGAQPDMKEAIRVLREEGLDVTTKSATERACALAVDADRAEFKNCRILGSQDTLFIQLKTHTYFKECFISGNTDYIFGDGDAVFDHCELQWYGYKDVLSGGYITAVQNQAPKGCLFLDCTVTSNKELQVEEGCFGRPWREGAHVVFLNTVLESEDMIRAAGWSDMSGGKAENSFFREYNTTLQDGTPVDTANRVKGTVMSAEEAAEVRTEDYFAGWIPYYYTEKQPEEDPDKIMSVEKFEDFTITISKDGISKSEILGKVPTSAAVTCASGEKKEMVVVWSDSGLEEIYTEETELVLTGKLEEAEEITVTIKVILSISEDPSEPTEPSDPEDPSEPTEPSDPEDPSEPTEPSDPEDPSKPTEPSDPEDPSEPTEPSDPEDPSKPTEPSDPEDPSEPTKPTEPSKPEKPNRPSYDDDDDDDDDEDDFYKEESDLTYSEQNKVESALGSTAVIEDVVESEEGKLVISNKQEVVFCEKDGTLSKDKWQSVDGSWYYFGSDNKAVSGWLKTQNKWYYMNQNDKKMETGWLKTSDGKWYLLDSVNGDMKNGWQMRGNKWYLLDETNGDMKTGWQMRSGKWYLLDSVNGDMKTGWQMQGNKWYLLDKISGVMKTGWQQTADGKWYYMYASGEMAVNTITPDGYKVNASGVWIH